MMYVIEDAARVSRIAVTYFIVCVVMSVLFQIINPTPAIEKIFITTATSCAVVAVCMYWISVRHIGAVVPLIAIVSIANAIASGVLMSASGVSVLRFSILMAMLYGTICLIVGIIAMLTSAILASLVYRFIRQFVTDDMCHCCGYNVRGCTFDRCPECGAAKWLLRGQASMKQ